MTQIKVIVKFMFRVGKRLLMMQLENSIQYASLAGDDENVVNATNMKESEIGRLSSKKK